MVHLIATVRGNPFSTSRPARSAPTKTGSCSAAGTTGSASTTGASTPQKSQPSFWDCFCSAPAPQDSTPPAPPGPPTLESLFGSNPWLTSPTFLGPSGVVCQYNPIYFATQQTAATVAQMIGGKVIQSNVFTPNGGGFQQQQANWMVELPDGRLVNPGLVAECYSHGYSQAFVDQEVAGIVRDS